MLVVLGVREESSSVVIEGVGGYLIQWFVGNRILDLLDVVEWLSVAPNLVVLRIYDAADEVFWRGGDDKW